MEPGTFSFRFNVLVKRSEAKANTIKIPIDVVIQPRKAKLPNLPILTEAKSAGDFTNDNKRRKEGHQNQLPQSDTRQGRCLWSFFVRILRCGLSWVRTG
jgi:hypothetical protein